jgi:hypothetical protein
MGVKEFKFYEYNSMYFTEHSEMRFRTANRDLFMSFQELEESDPSFSVEWILSSDRLGCYMFPKVHTENPENRSIVKAFLNTYYYAQPLDLYPEFVGKEFHLEQKLYLDVEEIYTYWF